MTDESGALVAARLAGLAARLDALEVREQQVGDLHTERFERTLEALQRIFDREQDDRRRLAELRASDGYDAAFTEPAPLITVVIPTLNRVDSLLNVALPSVFAQTHPAIEVVVVGDNAAPEMGEAIAALGDPRVRYHNLTMRGPYPDDPLRAWMASGTPPFNAAIRLARGRWIAPLADDDEFVPDGLATLLARAQADRLEWVYGKVKMTTPDAVTELGSFPPRVTAEGLQAPMQSSIFHAGLRFIELELAHAVFGTPNDVGYTRRMTLAGVRVGFVDQVVANYFPSMRGVGAAAAPVVRESGADAGLRAERDQLVSELDAVRGELAAAQSAVSAAHAERETAESARAAAESEREVAQSALSAAHAELGAVRSQLSAAHSQLAARQLRDAELTHTIDVITASRRWRWGEALKRLRDRSAGAAG